MKKNLLVLLLLSSLTKGQNYYPLLKTTAWYCQSVSFFSNSKYWYQVKGDTIVNSVPYKKFFQENILVALLREDTIARKVYVWRIGSSQEELYYDFSLSIGDVLTNSSGNYIIYGIDSILTSLGYRKRFQFYKGFPGGVQGSYVEGIGSLEDFFVLCWPSDPSRSVICTYEGNQNCYSSWKISNCPQNIYTNTTRIEKDITYEVFPNPFNKNTTIKYSFLKPVKSANLTVYDMQSRAVYKSPLKAEDSQLVFNAESLQNGVYIYSISVDGQEGVKKRFIVIK